MAELLENDPREVLCSCSGTTRGLIIELVAKGKDLDGISRYSGALSGCGGCEWEIGELVSQLQSQAADSTAQGVTTPDAASNALPTDSATVAPCAESP